MKFLLYGFLFFYYYYFKKKGSRKFSEVDDLFKVRIGRLSQNILEKV